ncbi:unnamed protein product [Soboliphyme baturini]|uniref:DUF2382 domain-containing protein n=1 Tax=Soboliphyme baturini TaxID=241478 RepID=A0A183IVX5_9BILA|nr:unnamed protein product [Soboliphyme baturini]
MPAGGDSNPEKLPFAKKLQRFQQVLSSTHGGSEEAQFPQQGNPRNDESRLVHNLPDDRMPNVDQAEVASKLPKNVRTRKAENRFRSTFVADESRDNEGLSPAEQRVLEAEKRAAWRKARLKSLEADAAKAELVMAKVRQLSEHREEPENKEAKTVDSAESLTPHGKWIEEGSSSDKKTSRRDGVPAGRAAQEEYPQKSSTESTKVVGAEVSREVIEHTDPLSGERVVKTVEKRQHITQHEMETTENRLLNIEVPVNREFTYTIASDQRILNADNRLTAVAASGDTSLAPKGGSR